MRLQILLLMLPLLVFSGRVRDGTDQAPIQLGSINGLPMMLKSSTANSNTRAEYSLDLGVALPITVTWSIPNAKSDQLVTLAERDSTLDLNTTVGSQDSPPTILLPTDTRLAAAAFASITFKAYSPQENGINKGITWTKVFGSPSTSTMVFNAGKLLFLDASPGQLTDGVGLYAVGVMASNGGHSVSAQYAIEFVSTDLRCSSASAGLATSCYAHAGSACTSSSSCSAACSAPAECVGRQSASITSSPPETLQCVKAGESIDLTFTGQTISTATGAFATLGSFTNNFFGASVSAVSQSGAALSFSVSVAPPSSFPPGLAVFPVQLDDNTALSASSPQFGKFIFEGTTPFSNPGVLSSVTPNKAVATRNTNILVNAGSILASPGLQCRFQLAGQSKQVVVNGIFSPTGVNCNLPPRTDLTDDGSDDDSRVALTVEVSNFGPCGDHTFSSLSGSLEYLNSCPAGTFLNTAMTSCDECPKGKFNDKQGATSASSCVGCPAGRYGDSTGMTTSSCTDLCPAGYYCPFGSAQSYPQCSNGFYGGLGETSPSCSGACDAGFYCNQAKGLQVRADPPSQLCEGGRYGVAGQTDSACTGDCEIGYFCPPGTSQNQMLLNPCGNDAAAQCDTGFPQQVAYCPWGSSKAACVDPGEYTWGPADVTNSAGTRGYKGSAWAGRYATGDGDLHPCPAGRYGATSRLTSSSCTGPCRKGYRCEEYSTYPTSLKCLDGLGAPYSENPTLYYCDDGSTGISGTNPPRKVDAGFYSTPEGGDALARSGQSPCSSREVCSQVDGKRRAKIEFRGAQLATNYRSRGQTWTPSTKIWLQENSPPGTLLLETDVRTNVPEASLRFRVEIQSAENSQGDLISACGDHPLDGSLFNIQIGEPVGGWIPIALQTFKSHDFERCAFIQFRLVAEYELLLSETYSLSGTILYHVQNANDPVAFLKPLINRSVDELSPQGTSVGVEMQLTSSRVERSDPSFEVFDEDKFQGMNFTIAGGNEDDLWLMLSCSGQVKVKQQNKNLLNYENQDLYSLHVRVCDDGRPNNNVTCDQTQLRIGLDDVNEPPVFVGSSYILTLMENDEPGALLNPHSPPAADPDFPTVSSNKAVVYSLLDGAGFVATNSSVYFATHSMNYEEVQVDQGSDLIPITLAVCDEMDVPACSEQRFQLGVLDVNDSPQAEDTTLYVAENSGAGVSVGSFWSWDEDQGANHTAEIVSWWAGQDFDTNSELPFYRPPRKVPDALPFKIVSSIQSSEHSFGSSINTAWEHRLAVSDGVMLDDLDYENVAIYTLAIRISDSGHAPQQSFGMADKSQLSPLDTLFNLTVLLKDVNEPPKIALTQYSISENCNVGTPVSGNGSNIAGLGDGIVAFDPDIGPGGMHAVTPFFQSLVYSKGQADSSPFAIDVFTGSIKTSGNINFEQKSLYSMVIVVEDVPASDVAARAERTIQIAVRNENEAPYMPDGQSFDLQENAAPGSLLGTVQYFDEDQLSTLGGAETATFAFIQPVDGLEIDQASGTISTRADISFAPHLSTFDFETQSQITAAVSVNDKAGQNASTNIIINVLNENEPPIPSSVALQFSDLRFRYKIGSLAARDFEQSISNLRFTWLSITALGELTQKQCSDLFPAQALNPVTGEITMQSDSKPSIIANATLAYKCALSYSVSDGFLTANHSVEITGRPFNEPPEIQDESVTIFEDHDTMSPIISSFNWSDPNQLDVHRWSIPSVSPPSGLSKFRVDRNTGSLYLKTALNFEDINLRAAGGFFLVVVRISDPLGAFADSLVNISVIDVNEPPFVDLSVELSCFEDSRLNTTVAILKVLDEDTDDSHSWSMVASNPARQGHFPFAIESKSGRVFVDNATMNVQVHEALDFESQWRGRVQANITVTDTSAIGSSLSTTAVVEIDVHDVNEAPKLTIPHTLNISEDRLSSGYVLMPLFGADPDRFSVNQTWRDLLFRISDYGSSDPASVSVDLESASLVVGSASLDFEMQQLHKFEVQVLDGLGFEDKQNISLHVVNVNDVQVSHAWIWQSTRTLRQLFTNGSDTIALRGSNLGFRDGKVSKISLYFSCDTGAPCRRNQQTGCSQPDLFNNTFVLCQVPVGFGPSIVVSISVDLGHGTVDTAPLDFTLGYSAPSIASVTGAEAMETLGGDLVEIVGENFGPAGVDTDSWIKAQYSRLPGMDVASVNLYRASHCTIVVNHTKITCQSVPGVGGSLYWSVMIGTQLSNKDPKDTSYKSPAIHSISVVAVNAVYNEKCSSNHHRPESLLSTAGGERIVIRGEGFGPLFNGVAQGSIEARLGRQGDGTGFQEQVLRATDCIMITEQRELECTSPSGSGANLTWVVTVAGKRSPINNSWSAVTHYRRPQLFGIHGADTAEFEAPQNLNTPGGDFIFLRGDQFGLHTKTTAENDIQVMYGPLGQETRYISSNCVLQKTTKFSDAASGTILSQRDLGQIRCSTVEGVGHSLFFTLVVGGQIDACSVSGRGLATSAAYNPPSIRIYSGAGANKANTRGNQPVLIEGGQFGPANGGQDIDSVHYFNADDMLDFESAQAIVNDQFGGNVSLYVQNFGVPPPRYPVIMTAWNCSVFKAHVTLLCLTGQGAGRNLKWEVTIGGQKSVSAESHVDPPAIWNISNIGAEAGLRAAIDIHGMNFGPGPESDSGDYLDAVSFGVDRFAASSSDLIPSDCVITTPHKTIRCTLPLGWSPPGASMDPALQYTFHVKVRGQTDKKLNLFPGQLRGDLWHFGEPRLLWLESHTGTNTVSRNIGISPFTSGLRANQEGFYDYFRIVGRNLGIQDSMVELDVRIAGVSMGFSVYSMPPDTNGIIYEVLLVRVPEGHGKNVPVQVWAKHGLFPGKHFEVPSDSPLQFSYRSPQLSLIRSETDSSSEPGFDQVKNIFGGAMTIVEMKGVSLGDAHTNPKLRFVQPVNESSTSDKPVFTELNNWRWGPVLTNLSQKRKDDRNTPFPFAWSQLNTTRFPVTPGWVWTTAPTVLQQYRTANAHDYIVSAARLDQQYGVGNHPLSDGDEVAPLPAHYIAEWRHNSIKVRMHISDEASLMVCSHRHVINSESCSQLTPYEAIAVTYGKGNGCPELDDTSASDTRGFTAFTDQQYRLTFQASTTAAVVSMCKNKGLNLRFLFSSGVRTAQIEQTYHPESDHPLAPASDSTECRIIFKPPPGTGRGIVFHLAIGLTYDSSSSCTFDYSFPKLQGAVSANDKTGRHVQSFTRSVAQPLESSNPFFQNEYSPVRAVGSKTPEPLKSSALGVYQAQVVGAIDSDQRDFSLQLTHLTITMPTLGGVVTLLGRNFGEAPWAGHMSDEARLSQELLFCQILDFESSRVVSVMNQTVFEKGSLLELQNNHTSAMIQIPPGIGQHGRHLAIRVGGQELRQLVTVSYEPPMVYSVYPKEGNTTGGEIIEIHGDNFGSDVSKISARIDGRACYDVKLLVPHQQISCRTPIGEGRNLTVEVSVHAQVCSPCNAEYSYMPPELSHLSLSVLRTDGSQIIEIHGWNFGLPQAERNGEAFDVNRLSPLVQFVGQTPDVRTYTVPDPMSGAMPHVSDTADLQYAHGGNIVSVNHGVIVIKAPQGQGPPRSVRLFVAGQQSINHVGIRFHPPRITGVNPASTPTRGHMVQVQGENLGRFELNVPAAINQALLGQPQPPKNTNFGVDMSLQDKGAVNGIVVHVQLPGMVDTMPCAAVSGQSIGTSNVYAKHVSLWKQAVSGVPDGGPERQNPYSESYSHSYFFCVMPAGFGQNITALYEAEGQTGFRGNFSFSYNPPFLARVTPNTVNAAGMDNLVISGEDIAPSASGSFAGSFGNLTNEVLLNIGRASCTNIRFFNERNFECNIARDTIGKKVLKLSAAGYANLSFPCTSDDGCNKSDISLSSTGRLLSARNSWSHLTELAGRSSATLLSIASQHEKLPTFIRVFETPQLPSKRPEVARLLNLAQSFLGDKWLSGQVDSREAGRVYAQKIKELSGRQLQQLERKQADLVALGYLRDLEMIHKRAVYDDHYKLSMICDTNQYGQIGEYCEACPQGAICLSSADDGCKRWSSDPVECVEFVEPFSMKAWWSDPVSTTNEFCHGPRKAGANDLHPLGRPANYANACPRMLPCEPPDACAGNNTCKYGYVGFRCKDCLKGEFYRVGGECIKCPNHAWVLIVVGVVALVTICIGGYILNRKKMHLAFISIGVDYMQVLAIFARSKVQWPAFIREMFRWMSMFNLNIDITAPECTVPEVSYAMKWAAVQSLPILISTMLILVFVAVFLYNVLCKGKRGRASREHGTTLLAVFTLMFYYMYLLLTRTTFDVFNCQPTDPHDGYDPGYMEAVFEPCYKPGGMHLMLLGPAIATLVIYVIGYPVLVVYCLYRYKFQIKADQILRAMNLGETPTNPFYKVRRVLHKLYYHFVPDKHYWILLIIFRKFCIALTSLMFRRTPSFQMALCFCILFFSYAMHAQNVPYMSMASRRQIVLLHKTRIQAEKKAPRSQRIHTRIEEQIRQCVADAARERTRTRTNISDILDAAQMPGSDYLFSYNTMEAVLLACGCFVCLAGIMFQTGDNSNPIYAAQREALTIVVLMVVFGSLTYFFTVFGTEVMVTFGLLQGPPQGRRGALMFLGGVLCCYTGVGIPAGAALCSLSARKPKDDKKLSVKRQNQSIDDAIDQGGENTGVGLNPLALKAAAGRSAGQNIDAVLSNQFSPTPQQWLLVQEFARMQHSQYQKLQDELEDAQTASKPVTGRTAKATIGASGSIGMMNPLARQRKF